MAGLIITLIAGIGTAIIFTLAHYNRKTDNEDDSDYIEGD